MKRTALYRHYDAEGRLLYVGISDCLSARDKQHVATSRWHEQVARTETEWHPSRDEALDCERRAIINEVPQHNVQFAKAKTPVGAVLAAIGTRDEIASECGVQPIAVYRWGQSGRIPSQYLPSVLELAKKKRAGVSADDLIAAHKVSPSTETSLSEAS